MMKAYMKYCWFGVKALWQVIAVVIFISIAGLPLVGLEKLFKTEFSSVVRVVYALFLGLPMLGAFFVWKSKQMWALGDMSETQAKN